MDKLKSFNGLPFINDILEEKLLSKQFILIPNSVIKSPPIVNLYDTKTKMNINDLLVKAYYEKTTPTLVPRVSIYLYQNVIKHVLFVSINKNCVNIALFIRLQLTYYVWLLIITEHGFTSS